MKKLTSIFISALFLSATFLAFSANAQELYDPRKEKNKIVVKM